MSTTVLVSLTSGHNFGFQPLGYQFIVKRQQQCFIIQKRDELKRGATWSTPKWGSNGGNLKMEIVGVKKRSKTCTRTVSSDFFVCGYIEDVTVL